jgi:hypothetical protein
MALSTTTILARLMPFGAPSTPSAKGRFDPIRQAVNERPLCAPSCRSVQRLVHHYCSGTIPQKSGWLAERFLRSKAVLYKEDTSGLLCKNPAHELLAAARCLRRSEGDPSIV